MEYIEYIKNMDYIVMSVTVVVFSFMLYASMIGRELGLTFWLFDTGRDMGTSMIAPLGMFFLYTEISTNSYGWMFFIAIGILLFGLNKLFMLSMKEAYGDIKDAIVLFIGKLFIGGVLLSTVLFALLIFSSLAAQEDEERRKS